MPERKSDLHLSKRPNCAQQRRLLGSLLLIFAFLDASQLLHAEDLGPHDIAGAGCITCHALRLPTRKVESANLWGNFNQPAYTSGDSETPMEAHALTDETPSSHSEACLICHDGSMAPGIKKGTSVVEGKHHPIDIPYPVGQSGYWPGTVTNDGVIFSPSNFDNVYGRPLRFYVSAGKAYIECTTCHDPHNYSVAQVTIQGHTSLKPTAHFVRGWYNRENPFSNSCSQFCRSCHFEQSNEAYGIQVATL